MDQAEPVTIDLDTVKPNRQTAIFFHAWMEGSDMWDGWAMFADLRTAMELTAAHYADNEYPHRNAPEDEECAKPGALVWTKAYGSWHLADGGQDTEIRITPTRVHGGEHRDQVLTEAAELIVAENDRQLRMTKPGTHWAADLLLAARTTQER